MISRLAKWGLLLWLAGFSSVGWAASLPEQVSAARSEVDALAEQLELQRRIAWDELSALRLERTELRRQVRLEEIRRDTLTQMRYERTKRVDDQEGRILEFLKPIQRSLASAKNYVSATLPFKQDERMRRLERIEADLAVTHPDAGRALTRVWRFIEEEEALAREIALSQQAITLQGKRLLVDVVRIGMALMYFRLPNGEVGWVRRIQDSWKLAMIEPEAARKTVLKVFEDLEKNRVLGPKHLLLSTELPPAVEGSLK